MKRKLEESLGRVEKWVERHNYRGYEPFDGLSSRLYPLTLDNTFVQRLLQQTVRQSPLNLRPLLGVKPLESTKGRGYMAWGYLARHRQTGDNIYKQKALECLDWLSVNKSPRYEDHSWGNHFDYASRCGKMPRHESTIVWTGLIGQVFLEAYEMFGLDGHREVINSIARWILKLPREDTKHGLCLSYVMPMQESVHNSNMIGAAFLAGWSKCTGNEEGVRVASQAMEYACAGQRSDGSWYYGEEENLHWVDNFHTGYNLDSLRRYIRFSDDRSFDAALSKGFTYFVKTFFDDDGCPRYYSSRRYPLDIQCASQAIDSLTFFSDEYDTLGLACKVANWTIDNMQDEDGHFHYRIYPLGIRAKAPMIHWGQATMYRALACLREKLGGARP
jgi:hypothetical protein